MGMCTHHRLNRVVNLTVVSLAKEGTITLDENESKNTVNLTGADMLVRSLVVDANFVAFVRSTFNKSHDTPKRSVVSAPLVSVSPTGMAGLVRGSLHADVTAIMSNVSGASVGVATGVSVSKVKPISVVRVTPLGDRPVVKHCEQPGSARLADRVRLNPVHY